MVTRSAQDQGQDQLFAALANATRREVLRLLRDQGPQPVQVLADHFAMSRPSLSEHLKVLREAGLVSEERQGRQRIYRLEAAAHASSLYTRGSTRTTRPSRWRTGSWAEAGVPTSSLRWKTC